jgi:hypothetical protein
MKMVYTHENSFIANNIKNLIEAQSIDVFIKNEYSQGAVGEVSAFDTWPEVWVFNDSDFERATEIVKSSQTTNTVDWTCQRCSETNDASFELCWKCQSEHL